MALIGYARVSSVGQSLHVQLAKLKHCDKIFMEKRSGAESKRSGLTTYCVVKAAAFKRADETTHNFFKVNPEK